MKNSVKNNIEVKLVTLKDKEKEKKAYGYGAEYEAEISFGSNKALIIVDSYLKTISFKYVSSNHNGMFDFVADCVGDRITLSDLLLKLKLPQFY